MTQSEPRQYHLPADAIAALAQAPAAPLTPALTLDEARLPFTLLDDFDQTLCRSGRALIETSTSLDLILPDGQVLSQSSDRKGAFVAGFPDGPVKQALADISPLRSLLPVGAGQMHCGQLALLDDEQKTHCRAHLRILTKTGTEGIAIATLRGLRGYEGSLATLRKLIEACGGTIASPDQLCATLFPQQDAYTAKPEIVIAADDTAFAAATGIIASYIPVVRANEPGIIADHDTEFLHDYRVALRKIRSVLSLFKGVYAEPQTDALKTRFSALMTPTGRLRDLDVYLLDEQQLYDLLPPVLHSGLDKMFLLFAEERKTEKTRLARHLQSKGYEKEISALAKLFHKRKKLQPGPMAGQGAHDYASALIWERYRKIRKTAARIGPHSDDGEVHRLRIHCKKLRYLMEFFAPLFPKTEFRSLLKPLKQLQDNLGLFNDYAVQQVSLQDFIRKHEPDGISLDVAQSVGALTAVLHQKQAEERAKVVETFEHFNSPETVATFRALFHTQEHRA